MLITPEQKRDHNSGLCDNTNSQEVNMNNPDVNAQISKNVDTLNDGNQLEKTECNLEHRQSDNETCDCNSPSSLYDLKNSNPPTSSSPQRPIQKLKAKFPPHINLSNPKKTSPINVRRALLINDDVIDCSQPLSPMSSSPVRSPTTISGIDSDKHELISGRLHLIKLTGNVSPSQSPSSPSRGSTKSFPFQINPAFCSPSSSPPLSSSPTLASKRKTPVYMRVYKCNMDHFALVSRDSSYSSKHMYLNMRHCHVMPGDHLGRFVIAGHWDSGSLMEFETSDLSSLEKWLDALHSGTPPGSPVRPNNVGNGSSNNCSPSIPKSPALPTLTETDEEN